MSTNTLESFGDTPLPPKRAQALSLWTFIHFKIPQFTSESALEVVETVAPQPEEDLKGLAKRLRRELANRGIHLKHVHALNAAALLSGHDSWYSARSNAPEPRLRLTPVSEAEGQLYAGWQELAQPLCAICDAAISKSGARVIQVKFGSTFVMFGVPLENETAAVKHIELTPIAFVNPVGDASSWLDGFPAILERLRRFLEECGRAILDGVAVLQLCDRPVPQVPSPQPVRLTDAGNSELVLLREDNGIDSYEIARGDELTCWSQLELAEDYRDFEVVFNEGAWLVSGGRYVWQLVTLHPNDHVPGLVTSTLSTRESEVLLRRYKMAKQLLSGPLQHHEVTKRVQYLSEPSDRWRVDIHRLSLAMDKAGLRWEDHCTEIGGDEAISFGLPIGLVVSLLEQLDLPDPNIIFTRPSRAELAPVNDDELLRALLPRIDHVTYRIPSDLTKDIEADVREAVEEFATSIQLQKHAEAGLFRLEGNPLPYLVYAGDGEELRLKLDSHDLVMYAGVMPHLVGTDGITEKLDGPWPFALGNSLYIDIDRR